MKKVVSFAVIVFVFTGMLSACQITYPDSESDFYFEKTMELLSIGDIKAAQELNCVVKGSTMEAELQLALEHLESRTVTQYKKINSEITNQNRSGGPMTQETATYEVTLNDGTVLTFHTFYSDGIGAKGFTSFELQSD